MREVRSPAFTMHGAREVVASGSVHLEQQINAIEEAVAKNPGLAFDLAKAIVETACKTILKDRGHSYDEGWDLPKLLKQTLLYLQLVPEEFNGAGNVSESMRKTVGGLQTVIQGLCELRNTQGFASHGKDAYSIQLEPVQALLAARAADAIVSFLFQVHYHYPRMEFSRRINYDDHPDFNDYVDQANVPVRIFDLEYRPSEILFNVDLQAYRDLLANYNAEDENKDEDSPLSLMEEETA